MAAQLHLLVARGGREDPGRTRGSAGRRQRWLGGASSFLGVPPGAPALLSLLSASYSPPLWASLAQRVKNPPTMRETWVRSPGWEDPLEKETANHFSTLAWEIPWTEEPGRLLSMESERVGHG